MQFVKVAACAVNQKPLDWSGNKARLTDALKAAREQGAQVIVTPELAITGYGCEDAFPRPDTQKRALETLRSLLPLTKGCVAVLGLPVLYKKSLFNCAAVCADARVLGFVAKRHLAGDGVHYEQRQFRSFEHGKMGAVLVGQQQIPIGDIYFDIGGIVIGVEICEDAWVPNRPGRRLAQNGVDLILNPNASHFAFGKLETRKRFVIDGSRSFNATIVYANLLGNEAGRIIYDGGSLIASGGKLLAQGPRFSFRDSVVTTAVVAIEKNRASQARMIGFDPNLDADPTLVRHADFVWSAQEFEPPAKDAVAKWEASPALAFEEFVRASAVGLFNYLQKSRQGGFTVCLSGGADSTTVVTLLALMVRLALDELGHEGMCKALPGLSWLADAKSAPEIMAKLVHTVYMPAAGSSDESRRSAEAVAGAYGCRFRIVDIEEDARTLRAQTEKYLERELSWDNPRDDLALQNIYARIRGTRGWAIANGSNHLLIPPSDLSEILVGYFTQGGDDSGGGPNPLGVRKVFILDFLKHMEQHGLEGLAPIPELCHVNGLSPNPELRPKDRRQSAEGDLGPYVVRDCMQDLFLQELLGPVEILHRIVHEFPQHTPVELHGWIKSFFRLFAINQWKRERLPVALHLDDHNLDPQSWLRWPVLSGNFEAELEELDSVLKSHYQRKGAR